jgi:hypothetical protein
MTALQYAALRLRYDPVLLLVAYRTRSDWPRPAGPAEVPGLPRTWRQVLDGGHGVRLPLEGLPPEDLLRLAAGNGYPWLSPEGGPIRDRPPKLRGGPRCAPGPPGLR